MFKLNEASLLKFATGHHISQDNEGWLMVQSRLHAGSISILCHVSITYHIIVALRVQNNNISENTFAHLQIDKYAEKPTNQDKNSFDSKQIWNTMIRPSSGYHNNGTTFCKMLCVLWNPD